jgi:hypothetical protein
MIKNKRETAENLAKAHFEVEPNLQRVFLLEPIHEKNPEIPIKLLEVVKGTIERGIEPIAFTADPTHGIEYPSMIVEISPREYQHLRNGKINFGTHVWTIGKELMVKKNDNANHSFN